MDYWLEEDEQDAYLQLAEEVKFMRYVPNGMVYSPNGRKTIQTLVVLEYFNPPPDGALEDADEEFEEDCKCFY